MKIRKPKLALVPRKKQQQLKSAKHRKNVNSLLTLRKQEREAQRLAAQQKVALLNKAIVENNEEEVLQLINRGVDINGADPEGFCPLQRAITSSRARLVKVLLEKGARANATYRKIIEISRTSNSAHIEVLVSSALTEAQYVENAYEITKLLVTHGAKVDEVSFHAALREGNWITVEHLLSVNKKLDKSLRECLKYAFVNSKDLSIARYFLGKLTNINVLTSDDLIQLLDFNSHPDACDLFKEVLDRGFKLDVRDPLYLSTAIGKHKLGVVKLLFEKGATLTQVLVDDFYPIHIAAMFGNIETLEFLVQLGADVNMPDAKGLTSTQYITPLAIAASRASFEVFKRLIELGAKLIPYPQRKGFIFEQAIENPDHRILKFLLGDCRAENNANMVSFASALQLDKILHRTVVYTHDHDLTKAVLDAGANVNARCVDDNPRYNGNTPLHNLIIDLVPAGKEQDKFKAVKLLVQRGADVNAINPCYNTPLSLAVQTCSKEIVQYLVSKGAKYDYVGQGHNLLHLAAYSKGPDPIALIEYVIKLFQASGIDIDKPNSSGATALRILTARPDLKDAIQIFIQHGANIYNPNQTQTLLLTAMENSEVIEELLLQDAIYNGKSSLEAPSLYANYTNYTNDIGETLAHYAAKVGNLKLLKLLLKSGAEVDCLNSKGVSLLQYAVLYGQAEAADLLISKGADVHYKSPEGNSVIDYALDNSHKFADKNKAIIELLRAHGVECTDNSGAECTTSS